MTLTTDKARWYEDNDGFWVAFRTKDRLSAIQIVAMVTEKLFEIAVKPMKKKRSLDANAYFWVLLDKLAAVTKLPKTELYRTYIRDIGGNSELVCVQDKAVDKLRSGWEHNGLGWVTDTMPSKIPGCTNVILYYGSSTYDSKQMTHLIDMAVDDCITNGIETKTPDELALMMARWGAENEKRSSR